MAKKEKKEKGYQGPKLAGDNSEYRKKALKRAEKNAQGEGKTTNAVFASSDGDFIAACEKAGVPATPRQASKFRTGYGKAAFAVGRSNRQCLP